MEPVYRRSEADQYRAQYASAWGDDLALRIYTSRLLGRDPALVLHGGGNTSVKTTALDVAGDSVEVLYVKGSGWDLAEIEPAGFPACRLEPLRRFCRLEAMTDDQMVAGLRGQMLDPASPTPSVEALLHAFLPGKFVDHTHADAVLTVQDQPNARELAAEIWGDRYRFIPYVMPGFALARSVVELAADADRLEGLILEQHGIFTWGATAEESYTRMIAGVSRAEQWRRAERPAMVVAPGGLPPAERRRQQALLAPVIRGACARAQGGLRFLMEWRDEEAILGLTQRPDGRELTARGTVTPDHVIRTKPRPLWLDAPGDHTTEQLAAAVEAGLADYARWYDDFFARGVAASGRTLTRLDALPRVVLVPGLGALTLGRTLADARIAGDIYARSAQVMQEAEAVGRYHPVGEAELFEVEYWSLEQAKLARAGGSGPLSGQVALVTGAAGGIGRATAEHLLALGAHVVLTDRAGSALETTLEQLNARFGSRVAGVAADVTVAAQVDQLVTAAVLAFGGVDILVSNAGTAPTGLLHTADGEAALAASLAINLFGHQRVAGAVSRVMLAQGAGGCLLFNASKSAVNQGPEFGPYAVPKAGVLALMRQYAVDLGRHGIRANAVNADRIRTELFGGGVLQQRAKARGLTPDEYFRQNLLGRETQAPDVAAAFGWLATAPATTGCVITVDGGNAAAFLR